MCLCIYIPMFVSGSVLWSQAGKMRPLLLDAGVGRFWDSAWGSVTELYAQLGEVWEGLGIKAGRPWLQKEMELEGKSWKQPPKTMNTQIWIVIVEMRLRLSLIGTNVYLLEVGNGWVVKSPLRKHIPLRKLDFYLEGSGKPSAISDLWFKYGTGYPKISMHSF